MLTDLLDGFLRGEELSLTYLEAPIISYFSCLIDFAIPILLVLTLAL